MDKQSYEEMIDREIADTVSRLLPNGSGVVTEHRLQHALEQLAQRVASHTRSYELLNLKASAEIAEVWGVSVRRVRSHVASLHERWGVGMKAGNEWLLSADEIEQHKPGTPGRPRKEK